MVVNESDLGSTGEAHFGPARHVASERVANLRELDREASGGHVNYLGKPSRRLHHRRVDQHRADGAGPATRDEPDSDG
jgi:hypothetical protein